MEKYPFIFSNLRRYRLQRHISFWAFWWIFQSFLYSFTISADSVPFTKRFPVATLESFLYLAPHIFLAYSLMYIIVPKFLLKGRYKETAVGVLFLFLVTGFISALTGIYVINFFRTIIFGGIYYDPHVNQTNCFLALLAGLRGGITIGGIAAAIKLMKYWHSKEQRNLQLQKENISTQLQLLKAQLHPHFLFNTLNNIYSQAQETSPEASKMIMGLSSLVRYMLYECNKPLVPLDKEIKMLQEYIWLEQSRYGNELDVNISLPPAPTHLSIAPLILLPFIENSFKHGTSNMLEQPWISLSIFIEDNQLLVKIVNGKDEKDDESDGIGLQNVRQRLDLLYPEKYKLSITDDADVFIVNLSLELEKETVPVMPVLPEMIAADYV